MTYFLRKSDRRSSVKQRPVGFIRSSKRRKISESELPKVVNTSFYDPLRLGDLRILASQFGPKRLELMFGAPFGFDSSIDSRGVWIVDDHRMLIPNNEDLVEQLDSKLGSSLAPKDAENATTVRAVIVTGISSIPKSILEGCRGLTCLDDVGVALHLPFNSFGKFWKRGAGERKFSSHRLKESRASYLKAKKAGDEALLAMLHAHENAAKKEPLDVKNGAGEALRLLSDIEDDALVFIGMRLGVSDRRRHLVMPVSSAARSALCALGRKDKESEKPGERTLEVDDENPCLVLSGEVFE